MKANEAPEKIFIYDYGSELSYEWHSESEFEAKGYNDIEYIRTDAFIEKASEWLNNFYSEDRHCFLVKEDIDAFIKAMEKY